MDFEDVSSSTTYDFGLFDLQPCENLLDSGSGTEGGSISGAGERTKSGSESSRRPYTFVPKEAKQSKEYVIRRQQNNKAVKRCRNVTKIKQQSLFIKAAGYHSLSKEYRVAAKQIEAARKNLEILFRQQLNAGESTAQLQASMANEELSRAEFVSKFNFTRCQYLKQLEALTKNSQVQDRLSGTSSDSSLMQMDSPPLI